MRTMFLVQQRSAANCMAEQTLGLSLQELPSDSDSTNRSACRAGFRSDPLEPADNRHRLHGDDRQPSIWLDTFHSSHEPKIWLEPGVNPGGVHAVRVV